MQTEVIIHVHGDGPMLMHNERLANPFDDITRKIKELTGKRKKTDDDLNAIMRLEFEGGLYIDALHGPYIPAWNFKRCLIDGGRINKLGRHIERSFVPTASNLSLVYTGPRDVESLWREGFTDIRSVKIGMSKTIRCRPRFDNWSLDVPATVDTSIVNIEDLEMVALNAGLMVGLGDFRQRYGRFKIEMDVQP